VGWEAIAGLVGPRNFQELVKKTINNFCYLVEAIDCLLPTLDEYCINQPLRDATGYLFTLDKCLLVLKDLLVQHSQCRMVQSMDLSPFFIKDPYNDLQGFTPSKLHSLASNSAVTVHKKHNLGDIRHQLLMLVLQPNRPAKHQTSSFRNKHFKPKGRGPLKHFKKPTVNPLQTGRKLPVQGKSCFNCGKQGHLQKDCRQGQKKT